MKNDKVLTKEQIKKLIDESNRNYIKMESDCTIHCPSGMTVSKDTCDMCSQCRPR